MSFLWMQGSRGFFTQIIHKQQNMDLIKDFHLLRSPSRSSTSTISLTHYNRPSVLLSVRSTRECGLRLR